ncbi:MAG: hypothetical protein K2O34_00005 [Acetatifactor sp.]|nr:hypothetical protein [Acetatifactor sp.]
MKSILEMTKYRLHLWKRGHLYVMPLVVLALFDGFCYSIRPAQLVACVVMLCFVLFLTMVWMGYMIAGREDPVEEQLLYLRVARKRSFYIGKSLFLLAVQLIFAAFAMAIPLLLSVMTADMFSDPITVWDLVQSFLLLFGSAGAGITLGSLLSSQVMRDRKLSLLLTVLMAVVSVLGSVLKKYAAASWFAWLLPPISAIGAAYGNSSSFLPERTLALWGTLVLYSIVYLMVPDIISYKRGF